MHSFEVHSNESACRKSELFGPEQVLFTIQQPDFSTLIWCEIKLIIRPD